MARPKVNIDWEKVSRMIEAGCEGTEVAAALGLKNPETLYKRCQKDHKMGFSEYKALKRASGDRLLKVKQFEIAMTGDKTMLIWLGKQRLGQTDRTEVTEHHQPSSVDWSKVSLEERMKLIELLDNAKPED